jgi:YgiT-type zinc finger domain-containing protein
MEGRGDQSARRAKGGKVEKEKAAFLQEAEAMYEEMVAWREKHPEASFDEIAAQVTPRRRKLMGGLLQGLARQHGDGRYVEVACPQCGEGMAASGRRRREVLHSEGETRLERAYHHCPACGRGLFPPGPPVAVE